jgi:hypothetical protein
LEQFAVDFCGHYLGPPPSSSPYWIHLVGCRCNCEKIIGATFFKPSIAPCAFGTSWFGGQLFFNHDESGTNLIIVPLSTEQLDQSNPYSSALRIVNTLDIARKEAIAMVCAGEIPFLTPAVPSKYTAPEIKRSMKAAAATRAYDTRFQGWYVLSRSFMTNIRLKEIQPTSVEQYQSDQRVWDYMHTSQYAQKYVDINEWNHLHPLDEVRKNTMWYGNKYIELDEVRDVVKARKKKMLKKFSMPCTSTRIPRHFTVITFWPFVTNIDPKNSSDPGIFFRLVSDTNIFD